MSKAVVDLSEAVQIEKQYRVRNERLSHFLLDQLADSVNKKSSVWKAGQRVMICRVPEPRTALLEIETALFELLDVVFQLFDVSLGLFGSIALGLLCLCRSFLDVIDITPVGYIDRRKENADGKEKKNVDVLNRLRRKSCEP